MKQTLEQLRKLAVKLLLLGKRIKEICKSTGYTKPWIYKWYNRYLTGNKNWFIDHPKTPHNIPHKTVFDVENAVVIVRKKLVSENSFKGAQAIQWEIQDLGFDEIPPISTINSILKRHNLTEQKKKRYEPKGVSYPTIKCESPNILHQADFLGPRYLTGGVRFYSLNLMDIATHRVGIEPTQSMHDELVVSSLTSMWGRLGIPKYLQLDNQLPFRGSNRYPRSFGLVIKLCVSLGIEPIFIPVNEPWRNGYIEKFGDTFQEYFLKKYRFNDFEHLIIETRKFEERHNQNYRYSFLDGKTPSKVFANSSTNTKCLSKDFQFDHKISLSHGLIHLMRFVRSDRTIDIFGEKFTVPKESIYEYVWATVDIKEQKLKLFLDHKQIEKYTYKLPKSKRCS